MNIYGHQRLETYLRLHEEGHAEINSVATHNIVLIKLGLATGLGKVEAATDVVLLEHLTESTLVLLGELDQLHGGVGSGLEVILDRGVDGEKLVAKRVQVLDNLGEVGLGDITAEQDTLTGLRHAEVHGGLEGRPVGLNQILTEASNLTGGGHLDAQEGVGTSQTGPGELGNLGGKVVTLHLHEVNGLGDITADESLGGDIDEVGTQDLADEGEGAGGAQVALNNLERGLSTLLIGLDDLHVEGTSDVPGLGDLLSDLLDAGHDGLRDVGGGQDKGGITGVNTSGLDVLGDGVDNQLTVGSDGIHIDLLGTLDELGDDNGVVRGNGSGVQELLLELINTVDDVHSGTGQDVTGTNQDGVTNSVGEGLSIGDRGQFLPGGLVDTNAIEDRRELVTVLSLVNIQRVGTQNSGTTALLQTEGNVLGQLATDRDNDTASSLELVDIHDTLVAELLEVQLVGSIEVSGVGLGVVVDHNGLLAHLAEGEGGVDSAPIELDGATDTVHTATQNDSSVVIEGNIVGGSVVGGVEVVGVGRELGSKGIDLLNPRGDAEGLTAGTDIILGGPNKERDLLIRETELLGLHQDLLLEAEEAADLLELVVAIHNVLDLVQEPLVDLGQLVDLVNGVVLVEHSLSNSQPAAIGGVAESLIEVIELITLETKVFRVNLTDCLLQGLLPGTTNSHNLTNRLHGGANVAVDVLELAQIPAGNLSDNVVQTGLEVGGGGLGNGVGELGKSVSQTNLSRGVSKRVTGGLGSQSRRTRKTSVDLDDTVVKSIGLQSVLDIALANDAQVTDNLNSSSAEHVVLLIRQSLTRGNNDTVTGVDSERVEVLHVANGDTVVGSVTNNLVLNLLPALEGLLDENLGGERQRAGGQVTELFGVGSEARTQTTKGVSRPDNDGVANLLGSLESVLDSLDGSRFGNRNINLVQGLGEEVTVFTGLQGLDGGTENLDTVAFKGAHAVHLHTQVQGGLTTEGEENTIRALTLNDVGNIFGGDGEVVDFIRKLVVGLDSRNVGVNQD